MAKEHETNGMKKIILIMGSVVCVLLATYVVRWILTGSPNPFYFETSAKNEVPSNGTGGSNGDGSEGTNDVTDSSICETDTETAMVEETQTEEETEWIRYDDAVIEEVIALINSYSAVTITKTVTEGSWDASLIDMPTDVDVKTLYIDYYSVDIKNHAVRELRADMVTEEQVAMYHDPSTALIADANVDNAVYYKTDKPSTLDYEAYDNLMDFIYAMVGAESFKTVGSDYLYENQDGSVYFKYGRSTYVDPDFSTDNEVEVYMYFNGEDIPQQCVLGMWKEEGGLIIRRTATFDFLHYSNDSVTVPSNIGE